MLFDQAELVLDGLGRPVFVLPVDLPEGDCRIHIHDESVGFSIENQDIGNIHSLVPEVIAWLASHEQAGIIIYSDENQPCPDSLTHVATIYDQREGA